MKCQKFPANAKRLKISFLYSRDKLTNYYFISAFLWVSNKVETGHICPASFPRHSYKKLSVCFQKVNYVFLYIQATDCFKLQKGTIKAKNKDGLAASDAQMGGHYACSKCFICYVMPFVGAGASGRAQMIPCRPADFGVGL